MVDRRPDASGTDFDPTLNNREILNTNNYGLYGRFYMAGIAPNQTDAILDTSNEFTIDIRTMNPTKKRNYNPIAQRLSRKERVEAWRGKTFTEAYALWRSKLKDKIHEFADPTETWAIQAVLGKHIEDFTEEDSDIWYNNYCKEGKSDVNGFVNYIIGRFQEGPEKKIDPERLPIAIPQIEWFARQLFGTESGKAVIKMLELETEINNNNQFLNKIFADPTRINNLRPDEEQTLAYLHDGLSARPAATQTPRPEPAPQPTATTTEPTPQERQANIERLKTEAQTLSNQLGIDTQRNEALITNLSSLLTELDTAVQHYPDDEGVKAITRKMQVALEKYQISHQSALEKTKEAERWRDSINMGETNLELLEGKFHRLTSILQEPKEIHLGWVTKELLPVIDSLYLAQQSYPEDEGLKLLARKFNNALESYGIKKIDTIGKDYDPRTMEAVLMIGGPLNKVINELTGGYTYREDRILRAASVIVGNGRIEESAPEPQEISGAPINPAPADAGVDDSAPAEAPEPPPAQPAAQSEPNTPEQITFEPKIGEMYQTSEGKIEVLEPLQTGTGKLFKIRREDSAEIYWTEDKFREEAERGTIWDLSQGEEPEAPTSEPTPAAEPVPEPAPALPTYIEVGNDTNRNFLDEINAIIPTLRFETGQALAKDFSVAIDSLHKQLPKVFENKDTIVKSTGRYLATAFNEIDLYDIIVNRKLFGPFRVDVTLSLTLTNSQTDDGNLIANLTSCKPGEAEGIVRGKLEHFNETLRSKLNDQIGRVNNGWQVGKFLIQGDRVMITVQKS